MNAPINPKSWRSATFTQDDIDAEIDANLPTNNMGELSAADFRGVLHDMNAATFQAFTKPNTWTQPQTFDGGAVVPTQPPGDSTTNAASTEFVSAALAAIELDTIHTILNQNNTWIGDQTFSGNINVVSQPLGDNSVKAASTQFVQSALADLLSKANTWNSLQAFNGGATVPTQPLNDNTTNAASTAFVTAAIPPVIGTSLTQFLTQPHTWSGLQTFNSGPVIPTQTAGDNSTNAASTAFVGNALTNFLTQTHTWTLAQTFSSRISINANNAIAVNGAMALFMDASNAFSGGSGNSTLTGSNNTAHGKGAGGSLTTGGSNVLLGAGAGSLIDAGSSCVAIGPSALGAMKSVNGSVAIGQSSLLNATNGPNIACGPFTLLELTTGTGNFGGGYSTGRGIQTGNNNTILGSNISGLPAGLTGSILLADGSGSIKLDYNKTFASGWSFPSGQKFYWGSNDLTGVVNLFDTVSAGGAAAKFIVAQGNVGANGVVLSLNNTTAVTGSIISFSASMSATSELILRNQNSGTGATVIEALQVGTASANFGPYFRANINGGQAWSFGCDPNASSAFKIVPGSNFGTAAVLKIDPTGCVIYSAANGGQNPAFQFSLSGTPPSGQVGVSINLGTGATGTLSVCNFGGGTSGELKTQLYNSTAGGSACHEVLSNTTAGYAITRYSVNAGQNWSVGKTNADNFAIAPSATLGSPAITITPAGAVDIPSVNGTLHVATLFAVGTAVTANQLATISANITDPAAGATGITTSRTLTVTANNAQPLTGIVGSISFNSGSGFTLSGQQTGGQFLYSHGAPGATVTTGVGCEGYIYNTNTGTITNAYAHKARMQILNAGGLISNFYGYYIGGGFNSGTCTNYYGVFVDDAPAGIYTNQSYGLYVKSLAAFFGGPVAIGGSVNANNLANITTNTADPAPGTIVGVYGNRNVNLTSNNSTVVTGVMGQAQFTAGAFTASGQFTGGQFACVPGAAGGTTSIGVGCEGYVYSTGTHTVTNAYAFKAKMQTQTAGSSAIGTFYGYYVGGGFNNGTCGTYYGMYVDDAPPGTYTTQYGLYVKSLPVWFGTGTVQFSNVVGIGVAPNANNLLGVQTNTNDPTSALVGVYSARSTSITATNGNALTGVFGQASGNANGAFAFNGQYTGGQFVTQQAGTGGSTNVGVGCEGYVVCGGSHTINNAYAFKAKPWTTTSTATITNFYGLYVGQGTNAGTITNYYGAYLDDPPAGTYTNKYGLYVKSTLTSFLGGSIIIQGNLTLQNSATGRSSFINQSNGYTAYYSGGVDDLILGVNNDINTKSLRLYNSDGHILMNAGIASTTTTTGTLQVTGGVGITGNINAGGTLSLPVIGSPTTPAINFGQSNTGIYGISTTQIGFSCSGLQQFFITSNLMQTNPTFVIGFNGDAVIGRNAAGNLRLGMANASAPVSQILTAQGSRSGTDVNVGGGNLTIQSGPGTGTGTPSTISFQTPISVMPSGSGGQNYATGLTIANGAACLTNYTVSTLPTTPPVGALAVVTDQQTSPAAKGVAPVGGGTVPCVVVYNGAAGWQGI